MKVPKAFPGSLFDEMYFPISFCLQARAIHTVIETQLIIMNIMMTIARVELLLLIKNMIAYKHIDAFNREHLKMHVT